MPNRLSQFWQELKRRKVTRVITVYAAAAFVIIELVDIVAPNLGLPSWTFNLVLILLLVGFLITVIFSWVYDIHPEGGIVKTEPAHKVKPEDIPKSSNTWKIASYISFVVIVGLIVLNIIPRSEKKKIIEKSIAVLPFVNDSPDEENAYFINGIMEEVLLNLQAIKELRVPGRTSVEQYRTKTKSIPEIAEELDVNYILEGSGQKYGDRVVLRVQLLEGATDRHLWGDSYEEEINNTKVIIGIQSQIAQSIAAELQAVITPTEKVLIEKIPTTNQTAYDFYQRGKEEHWKYRTDPRNLTALDKAEEEYNKALSYDSTFGQAYLGLAEIYMDRNIATKYFSENYLDSALVLINQALSYDNTLAEAYVLRGTYYRENGYRELAIIEYDKALEINPNSWEAYRSMAGLYWAEDLVVGIDNLYKAISLYRGRELPGLLGILGNRFEGAGFPEIARNYYQEKLNLDNDSISFYLSLAGIERDKGNDEGREKYARKVYMMDSTNIGNLYNLGTIYGDLGRYKESLVFYEKWLDQLDKTLEIANRYSGMHRVGYAYWMNERYEEAENYFDLEMEYCNSMIELDNPNAQRGGAYYDRACIFAFRGEREKAFEDGRIGMKLISGLSNWMITLLKRDPLFDSVRDDPEFQQIVRDAEDMFQAEHERVRQWLEEHEML